MNRIRTENPKATYSVNVGTEIEEKQNKKIKEKREGSTIYAGDLNILQPDLLAQKNNRKKSAFKVLRDAFLNEQKIDEAFHERRKYVTDLHKEANDIVNEIKCLDEQESAIKDIYGITDDSTEQKDLELLKKKINMQMGLSDSVLTKEEQERLENMGPLTDYQEAALEYHVMKARNLQKLSKIRDTIKGENQSIEEAERERLKTHPIVDVMKIRDKLIEEAVNEFKSDMIDQVKNKIDENMEENAEKAEKMKEKEEKEKVRKGEEKVKDKDDIAASDYTKQLDDTDWSRILRQIKVMANKENLLEEDFKGLTVDEQL